MLKPGLSHVSLPLLCSASLSKVEGGSWQVWAVAQRAFLRTLKELLVLCSYLLLLFA